MLAQARLGELDRVLVAVLDREVDQRLAVFARRLDLVLGGRPRPERRVERGARLPAEAERRAQRRARLINSAGGPDLGDETVMSGAWA